MPEFCHLCPTADQRGGYAEVFNPMADNFPEYMSTHEAEDFSGLRGLAKRRVLGTSPPYIKTGNSKGARVLYSKTGIDAWMAERVRKHTSEHSAAVAMTEANAAV